SRRRHTRLVSDGVHTRALPISHCAETVRNCPAVARDSPGCADAFSGSAPSARPPRSSRPLFPSGERAVRDAAGDARLPGAVLLPPSPGSSGKDRPRAAGGRLLLAEDPRPRPWERSSGCWGSLRGQVGGTVAPLVAGRSGIVFSSRLSPFSWQKNHPRPIMTADVRVATFYELTDILTWRTGENLAIAEAQQSEIARRCNNKVVWRWTQ